MWKQWCGIGKNTDLQTDWHPVALSIHITTVGCFRTQDSWRRWIMVPCLEVPLSHTDSLWITGLLLQGVPPAACGSVQWIPLPGVRSSPCWGHMPQLSLRVSFCVSVVPRGGGSMGWWKRCSLHRAVALQLKALTALSSLHHSVSLSTHYALPSLPNPFQLVLCNLFGAEVYPFNCRAHRGCCDSTLLVCGLALCSPDYDTGTWELPCGKLHTN